MSRRAGDPLRDFHRVDLLWTALVIAVAVGAILGDYSAAAGGAAASAAGALRTGSVTAAERVDMIFGPITALLRSTQTSLAYIPVPWDLVTWTHIATPFVAASAQVRGCSFEASARGAQPRAE